MVDTNFFRYKMKLGRSIHNMEVELLCDEIDRLRGEKQKYEDAMLHCVEYWNRSETDGAMSDALHEIVGTLTATLPVPQEVEVVAEVENGK